MVVVGGCGGCVGGEELGAEAGLEARTAQDSNPRSHVARCGRTGKAKREHVYFYRAQCDWALPSVLPACLPVCLPVFCVLWQVLSRLAWLVIGGIVGDHRSNHQTINVPCQKQCEVQHHLGLLNIATTERRARRHSGSTHWRAIGALPSFGPRLDAVPSQCSVHST